VGPSPQGWVGEGQSGAVHGSATARSALLLILRLGGLLTVRSDRLCTSSKSRGLVFGYVGLVGRSRGYFSPIA
jgi:hypothetical protein